MQTGLVGRQAPALRGVRWLDASGEERGPLSLDDLGNGYRILFFFQHWCPGCHSHGFPTLARLVAELAETNVGFAAIQTVFEGFDINSFDRIRDDQRRYDLNIPFGHAAPEAGHGVPLLMEDFRTGGTPWFVVIVPDGNVAFEGFEVDADALIRALLPLTAGPDATERV